MSKKNHHLSYIIFAVSLLPALTGCLQTKPKIPSVTELKYTSLTLKQDEPNNLSKEPTYNKTKQATRASKTKRDLTLSFTKNNKEITNSHKNLIHLFFQTLPTNTTFNITLSAAPTNSEKGFAAFQSAWSRTQSLKQSLQKYTKNIKKFYRPNQKINTVNIQVTEI